MCFEFKYRYLVLKVYNSNCHFFDIILHEMIFVKHIPFIFFLTQNYVRKTLFKFKILQLLLISLFFYELLKFKVKQK